MKKGYMLVRGFLTEAEMRPLREDYAIVGSAPSPTQSYDVRAMSAGTLALFASKLQRTAKTTKVPADLLVGGFYFATSKMHFRWHQDHDSYYTFQQHDRYLNFYVPIIKPHVERSNICVIPFDALKKACPREYDRFEGSGAKRLRVEDKKTQVDDDETGKSYVLDVDLDTLAFTPELRAGDLLLMRGDMIHRTQTDNEPERVAASFRMTDSSAIISEARLNAGCPAKDAFTKMNSFLHPFLTRCFAQLGALEMTAAELMAMRRGSGR